MPILLTLLIVLFSWPAAGWAAINFDGTDDIVDFNNPTSMHFTNFTVAAWFYRAGNGSTASTGTAGITSAEPIIAKLVAEADASNVDGNFFIGINRSNGTVFAADYEDRDTGLNWPVNGTSTISTGSWYFGAATFDGTNFKVYINGVLDGSRTVASLPRSDSIQELGFGQCINSTNVKTGGFNGYINEVAIWDTALAASDIQLLFNAKTRGLVRQISPTNLKGYWPMNEGSDGASADGVSVLDRTGNGATGTADNGANNTGLTWRADDKLSYP
jgi:hypothetical protein